MIMLQNFVVIYEKFELKKKRFSTHLPTKEPL